MLKRVVVINSKVYGKAEIKMDDCDSLQLVGANNVGKSTLIYALNFLFVVDGNKMSFSGQRKGDKETIHHYFPTPNQSYIIFEVYRNSPYCILLKRDTEGELEYYRYNQEYNESDYYRQDDGQMRLMKFEELRESFELKGYDFQQFKNKSEVFNFVYQRGRGNNGVVWLEDSVKTDGLSNNFSKIYRYLINTKLITNKSLKEALVIADNRENEILNFSQKNRKDIYDLLKINDEIRNIKSIRNDFIEFREIVNQYIAKSNNTAELLYAFNAGYTSTIPDLEVLRNKKGEDLNKLQTELNEVLKPKEQALNRKIGQKEFEITTFETQFKEKQNELNEINNFEPLPFLKESLKNLDLNRKNSEARITTIESQKLTKKEVQDKVDSLSAKISSLEKQKKNYNNLLIHNISDSEDTRKLLNAVLSEQVKSLPKDQILGKVKKVAKSLKVFDGEIDIDKNVEIKDFTSVEEITKEIKTLQKEKEHYENLLPVITDFEAAQAELQSIKQQIETVGEKIKKLGQKAKLEKLVARMTDERKALLTERDKQEKELKVLKDEILKIEAQLQDLQDQKKKLEDRIIELKTQKNELEQLGITPVEYVSFESLESIYHKIKMLIADRTEMKGNKDRMFDRLRDKVNSTIAGEEEFINYIEEELACIHDKEKSIDSLLQSISTQFANPAYTLLKRYEEFKQFLYNKFNQKLSKTRISDIESLRIELNDNKRLMDELRKISEIQELNGQLVMEFDQSDNLKVLNNFLDNSRKIHFDELFEIELHLTLKGSEKKVDLSGQVESDGTDRMIRLVIIMSIINRLAIHDEQNKIALFIDEVATIDKHNRPELVRFCNEHFFIPIFAAPDPVPGFNKYYFIYPSKGKININEKVNAIFGERTNVTAE